MSYKKGKVINFDSTFRELYFGISTPNPFPSTDRNKSRIAHQHNLILFVQHFVSPLDIKLLIYHTDPNTAEFSKHAGDHKLTIHKVPK